MTRLRLPEIRGWMASVLAGAALLLLTGCQSAPRPASPPVTALPPPATTPIAQPRYKINPSAWKTEADHWLGVKYRKGGTQRSGIDCSGLTSQMYLNVAGIALPRTAQDQSRCGTPVSRTDLRPGDLIFFISLPERTVNHVGLYLGDAKFVHASPTKGVVVSSLLQDYYVQRFHSARRIIP